MDTRRELHWDATAFTGGVFTKAALELAKWANGTAHVINVHMFATYAVQRSKIAHKENNKRAAVRRKSEFWCFVKAK